MKSRQRKSTEKVILIIMLLLTLKIIAKAKEVNNNIQKKYIKYTVAANDTIWDIAKEYNIYKDIREMAYWIKTINNNKDSIIYPGEVLLIPIN